MVLVMVFGLCGCMDNENNFLYPEEDGSDGTVQEEPEEGGDEG